MTETVTATETPDWQKRGKCGTGEYQPDLWHMPGAQNEADAKAICYTCPVMETCRIYSLTKPEPWGVWGGTTESERARHISRSKKKPATALGPCDGCGRTRYSIANPYRYLPEGGVRNSVHNTPRTKSLCQDCHPADTQAATGD